MRHSLRGRSRLAFTLVGTLVGLLLPAVQAAREAARNNTCKNNLKQMGIAIQTRETSQSTLPGYINPLGITGSNFLSRASWVVTTFPYIEQNQLFEQFSNGNPDLANLPQIEILVCPSNPPAVEGAPNLSYVANSGYRYAWNRGENTSNKRLSWENAADGVFLDRTRLENVPNGVPWKNNTADKRDNPDSAPLQSMSIAYIQSKGDGTSKTLMFSESLAALYWGYSVDPADPTAGDYFETSDANFHFGFTWVQPDEVVQDNRLRINGSKEVPLYDTFADMNSLVPSNAAAPPSEPPILPRPGIASSFHPGGVNATFVGSQVSFITDQIEPFVFAQLMTSNRKQSSLGNDPNYETNAPEPEDGSY